MWRKGSRPEGRGSEKEPLTYTIQCRTIDYKTEQEEQQCNRRFSRDYRLDDRCMLNLVSKEHRKPEDIVATSIHVIERWGAATEKHPMLSLCWMLFPDSQQVKEPIMHSKRKWYVSMLHVCPRNPPAFPSLLFLLTMLPSHRKRVLEMNELFDKHL
jgi:hypothetical protein